MLTIKYIKYSFEYVFFFFLFTFWVDVFLLYISMLFFYIFGTQTSTIRDKYIFWYLHFHSALLYLLTSFPLVLLLHVFLLCFWGKIEISYFPTFEIDFGKEFSYENLILLQELNKTYALINNMMNNHPMFENIIFRPNEFR